MPTRVGRAGRPPTTSQAPIAVVAGIAGMRAEGHTVEALSHASADAGVLSRVR
jgi:hypothetical protein